MEEELVCTKFDAEKYESLPYWKATLSNGLVVYEDDRPEFETPQSWLRLSRYCQDNHLRITDLSLIFRSHHVPVESNCLGYYFSKGNYAMVGLNFDGRDSYDLYNVGIYRDGKLYLTKYKVPELEIHGTETRELTDTNLELLITPISYEYSTSH